MCMPHLAKHAGGRCQGGLMRRIRTAMAFVIGMVASCSGPAGAQTLRDEAIAAIRKAVPDAKVTMVDALAIKVKPPGGGEIQINLDRIQHFCDTNNAEDCAGEKQRFLDGIAE